MSQDLPDSFDEQQPDLPSLGVDPDPIPDDHEGNAPTRSDDAADDAPRAPGDGTGAP